MILLSDLVAILPDPADTLSKGGIVIPSGSADRPQKGYVLTAGPGGCASDGTLMPPTVRQGDYVLFGKYVGTDVEIEGKKVLIIKESGILAILHRAPTESLVLTEEEKYALTGESR